MLAGVMLVASQASAQTAKQAAKQARRAARLAAAQSIAPASSAVVAALKSAHTLLVTANHDYEGHRAKAAKEVHQALRALGYHAAVSTASVSTPSSKVHEAQANSDTQLLQAQQILHGVAGQVSTGHVARAINEINKALAIR
jgi:hypothetical protein